ncbi:MAG: hypothetical protein ACFCGT_15325 [Sandaracinaceae bacterium]
MSAFRLASAEGVDPAAAVGVGGALRGTVGREVPAALYVASLRGDARVFGRWQVPALTLRSEAAAVRRWTGGPATVAGDGVLYLALALARADVFLETPRDRILNRTVRGLLGGLRAVGFAAHYFGREFVSVDKRPAGLLGWARAADGRVLFEAFLGAERTYPPPADEVATPARREPPRLGKAPLRLADVGTPPSAAELCAACARAWDREGALEPVHADPPAPGPPPPEPPAQVHWSEPREVPIGWIWAGLARGPAGVTHARIAGDLYQDDDGPDRLSAALMGAPPSPERLRDGLNAALGTHGATVEGLRSLQPALEAFLEVGRAPS